MRDDRGRLQDILDAIKRIERYAKRGRPVFEEDELVHTWMIHQYPQQLPTSISGAANNSYLNFLFHKLS